jgi:sterol desaturase/sphingolipid hydroxylase (fatty acid hydroxylase superfamily)
MWSWLSPMWNQAWLSPMWNQAWLSCFAIHLVTYWGTCFYYGITNRVTAKKSLLNQFCITLPLGYLLNDALEAVTQEATFSQNLVKLLAIMHISNVLFYSFHLVLHTKWLYKNVHYLHHKYHKPIPEAALFAHPIEHLLTNNLAFVLPVLMIGIQKEWLWFLVSFSTLNIVLSHTPVGRSHSLHHKRYKYNYGFGEYLDAAIGTRLVESEDGKSKRKRKRKPRNIQQVPRSGKGAVQGEVEQEHCDEHHGGEADVASREKDIGPRQVEN